MSDTLAIATSKPKPKPKPSLADRIDAWLLAPRPGAAGSLGIFRILYCLFCLWELSFRHSALLAGPALKHLYLGVLMPFPDDLSPIAFQILESLVVAALVLLMFGWRVRVMTAAVLVLGGLLSAYWNAADVEIGDIFVAYLIPVAVIAGGTRWGDCYSIDASRSRSRSRSHRARRGDLAVDPGANDGIYALPSRAVLVLLAAQFVSSALCKVLGEGTWLHETGIMGFLAAEKNIEAAIYGLPLNPLGPHIAQTPWAYHALQYGTLLFEGTFFLALVNARLRRLYLCAALVFHSVNALWFMVTFTPILIVYGMYVDWERLRMVMRVRLPVGAWTTNGMIVIAMGCALLCGSFWNTGFGLRRAMSLGGLIDYRTIWWPILPVAIGGFVCAAVGNIIALAPRSHRMGSESEQVAVGSVEDNR